MAQNTTALEKLVGDVRRFTPGSLLAVAGLFALSASAAWGVDWDNVSYDDTVGPGSTAAYGAGPGTNVNLKVSAGGAAIDTPAVTVGNSHAISLGSGAGSSTMKHVYVEQYAVVENKAVNAGGHYNSGANTIEVGSFYNIGIYGTVQETGTQNNAEAINIEGLGNFLEIGGTGVVTSTADQAAIWFQNRTDLGGNAATDTNVIHNHGLIQRAGGSADLGKYVFGASSDVGIDFTNFETGTVDGNMKFGTGNDKLTVYAHSVFTGIIEDSGGDDTLTLQGRTGTRTEMYDKFVGFDHLVKDGDGVWLVAKGLDNHGSAFKDVTVKQGELMLDGDNSAFAGSVTIDPDGVIRSKAESMTGRAVNNGTLIIDQVSYKYDGGQAGDDKLVVDASRPAADSVFDSVVSGNGKVVKVSDAKVVMTNTGSSYTGGTEIREGALSISDASQLGADSSKIIMGNNPADPWTPKKGTLEVTADTDLSSRPVVINASGGVFDLSNSNDLVLNGNVAGTGLLELTDTGAVNPGGGVLALYGDNSGFSGGVHAHQGTVTIDNNNALGSKNDFQLDSGTGLRFDADMEYAGPDIGLNYTVLPAGGEGFNTIDTNGHEVVLGAGKDIMDLNNAGSNGLIKDGVGRFTIQSGTATSYKGTTEIAMGALQVNGHIGVNNATAVTIDKAGVLEGVGVVMGEVTNHGNIYPGAVNPHGDHVGTLTIDGNYNGAAGATLTINGKLMDDQSYISKLVITGNSKFDGSNPTVITVNNLGGTGAYTDLGIEIVDVQGAESDAGAFVLDPHYIDKDGNAAIVVGKYVYHLKKGDNYDQDFDAKNWYLVDSGHVNPSVPLYEFYDQHLSAFNRLPTLVQRVGNRYWTGSDTEAACGFDPASINAGGVWVRSEGSTGKFNPRLDSGVTTFKQHYALAQVGVDIPLAAFCNGGRLVLGPNFYFGRSKAKIPETHLRGDLETKAYGGGLSLTWYDPSGFYADLQGRYSRFKTDIESHVLMTVPEQVKKNRAHGYAFSLELGKLHRLNANWSLTPQVQMTYSRNSIDSFVDTHNAAVSFDKGESLLGRLGMAVNWEVSKVNCNGQVGRTKVYALPELTHEFKGKSHMTIDGVKHHASRGERTWLNLAIGATQNFKDDRFSIYGEVSSRTSTKEFFKSYEFAAEVGFRIGF